MKAYLSFFVMGVILIAASGLAIAMRPVPTIEVRDVDLERQIPTSFGEWHEIQTGQLQVDIAPRGENGEQEATLVYPYDRTLSRFYQRADGQIVMLTLAWGSKQRQEIKVHRPELCYMGQGLQVVNRRDVDLSLAADRKVTATQMLTSNLSRSEPVTYWIRTGDQISMTSWQSRVQILNEGLHGRIPDGMLVRVSQALAPSVAPDESFRVQATFLRSLFAALDADGRRLLAGNPR